jgi:hypothetical protein
MIPKRGPNRTALLSRAAALILGIALGYLGISAAADVGEILVAVPFIFLGAIATVFAFKGRWPWRRVPPPRGAPPNDR